MKKKLTLLFVLFSLVGRTQVNLVVNPSFEDTVDCPTGPGEIQQAIGWSASRESPDYFNSCTSSFFDVPNNSFGYQQAVAGNAYAGIICFNNSIFSREIITDSLIAPLSVGQKYFITFKVNKGDDTSIVGYSTNKIGATFSTLKHSNVSIDNMPLVYTNSVVSDTLNWTRISGSFIADSAYRYLMIGNFFDDANTTAINNGMGVYAYYYIDDVCLSTDSLLCANFYSSVEANNIRNRFSFYPNPASNFVSINSDLQTTFGIEVYNAVGRLLYTEQNVTNNSFQLDISQYSNGLFFIKITSQNNQLIYKLLKL